MLDASHVSGQLRVRVCVVAVIIALKLKNSKRKKIYRRRVYNTRDELKVRIILPAK